MSDDADRTPPSPLPSGSSDDEMSRKIDKLKELGDRKARGTLTEEEYAAEKRKVLGGG